MAGGLGATVGGGVRINDALVHQGPGCAKAANAYQALPLTFEENEGQTDDSVDFLARFPGYTLFVSSSEAVVWLRSRTGAGIGSVLRMHLENASPSATASGIDLAPGVTNYFLSSDPKQWHSGIPNYSRVKVAGVYPGIDLIYYANRRQLEYDFVVAPGANARAIRLGFSSGAHPRLDGHGNLRLETEAGELRLRRPVIYQLDGSGTRKESPGAMRCCAETWWPFGWPRMIAPSC